MSWVERELSAAAHAALDDAAWHDLLSSEWDRLLLLARDVIGDDNAAEDAVQDTLEIAWRRRGQTAAPDGAHAWLTRICVRRCLRLRGRFARRDQPDADGFVAPQDYGPDPTLHRAVSRLSRPQRAVIVLRYRDGYSVDQCAAAMGCRPGSARRRLHRALTRLRQDVGDESS